MTLRKFSLTRTVACLCVHSSGKTLHSCDLVNAPKDVKEDSVCVCHQALNQCNPTKTCHMTSLPIPSSGSLSVLVWLVALPTL